MDRIEPLWSPFIGCFLVPEDVFRAGGLGQILMIMGLEFLGEGVYEEVGPDSVEDRGLIRGPIFHCRLLDLGVRGLDCHTPASRGSPQSCSGRSHVDSAWGLMPASTFRVIQRLPLRLQEPSPRSRVSDQVLKDSVQ